MSDSTSLEAFFSCLCRYQKEYARENSIRSPGDREIVEIGYERTKDRTIISGKAIVARPVIVFTKEQAGLEKNHSLLEANVKKFCNLRDEDHCSSTTTTVDNTTTLISSSAAATNTAISALLEFQLMGISHKKENLQQPLRPQMSVEKETFKLEMMSAEAMISILQSRVDALRQV